VPESWVGRTLELDVGAVAQGGHCVARVGGPGGRVVFVCHALPGERVRALVTEDGGGAFCRADAVEVLTASASRVPAPCPHAGPGRCGGCDWQHIAPAEQRELKAAVIVDQLDRLAGLRREVVVEELPGGPLGWRTRMQFAVTADGRLGLRRHRSANVEVLDRCPIGAPGVGDAPELSRQWPGAGLVELAVDEHGGRALSVRAAAGRGHGRRPAVVSGSGPAQFTHSVHGLDYTVDAAGFWQVHPAMAGWLVEVVLDQLRPDLGERVLDLYAGAGLFTAALAAAVGPTGTVLGIESDTQACVDAVANLQPYPWAAVRRDRVTAASISRAGRPDVVVLDPPRSGAGAAVMRALLALRPRVVSYVACDPAALARDLRTATEADWRLAELRAVDGFPMTQHVECVAQLLPDEARER
jgi:tRNA/tmRNA/rRNA uracil-C5-methylase (TrmA/RlmC/RlmD family)